MRYFNGIVTALGLAILASTAVVNGQETAPASSNIGSLVRDLARVESVREIKDLQRSLAHFAQFGKWSDVAALFSDDGTLHWGLGSPLDEKNAAIKTGPAAIEEWFSTEAGSMDGVQPGSLYLFINEMPLITLSEDGTTAKGRWHALRFMGDGEGKTKIQGGIFENEYARGSGDDDGRWRISLLHYYPMFSGDYANGWKSVAQGLPIIPYHFTPDEAGIPIPRPSGEEAPASSAETFDDLAYRIAMLNAEDDVRNLQHSYGYYVDQRMWTDVLELFASDGTMTVDGSTHSGSDDIRSAIEDWMGPEGLTKGILNERPNFHTMVNVSPDGQHATTRGLEFGMIGDANAHTAKWEFNIFHNDFAKDPESGIWKLQNLNITHLMVADYTKGWGNGGLTSASESPAFLDRAWRFRSESPESWHLDWISTGNSTEDSVADLRRRLSRSAAFDETENVSGAYGYFADDIRCTMFADLYAQKGFKESPGTGWYITPQRIAQACTSRYGSGSPNPMRPAVPFHWRPQPVILVSQDGRSTSLRARILQLGTSSSSAGGFNGVWGFNGGMYHDQFVLEDQADGTARRKLWSLTIDEFYWQSSSWAAGWAGVSSRKAKRMERRQNNFPPDISLKDPKMGEREAGLSGGSGQHVSWPDIVTMWWSYRNPVSGRVPEHYWGPGCVPCRGPKPEWALTVNDYQEPPTGYACYSGSGGREHDSNCHWWT